MAHFLSYPCLESKKRCFGRPAKPVSKKFHRSLTKCLAAAAKAVPLDSTRVQASEENVVQFSSPVAERYYFDWIKPSFAYHDPESLRELIKLALGSFSASGLRSSVDQSCFPAAAHELYRREHLPQLLDLSRAAARVPCVIFRRSERGAMGFFVSAKRKSGAGGFRG